MNVLGEIAALNKDICHSQSKRGAVLWHGYQAWFAVLLGILWLVPLTACSGTVVVLGGNSASEAFVDYTNVVSLAAQGRVGIVLKDNGTVANFGGDPWDVFPYALTNVIAVAAGEEHRVALRADGKVFVRGYHRAGQHGIPPGLSNVIAITAGDSHSVALKADGSLVSWGESGAELPAGLTNVVAISSLYVNNLALTAEGTIFYWGWDSAQLVPESLTNVVAVAAGCYHQLALKADRTVVGWGNTNASWYPMPQDLTNIAAIMVAGEVSVAVRADGTVVAWGGNIAIPGGVSNLVGMVEFDPSTPGGNAYLGLVGDGPARLAGPIPKRMVCAGGQVFFHAAAVGTLPIRYQWQRDGVDLPGATNATLWLTNVQSSQAGDYQVVVSNALGSVVGRGRLNVVPLFISAPPFSQMVTNGGTVALSVKVQSALPVVYQWQRNGVDLPDATNASLSFHASQNGSYAVIVSNALGSVRSQPAFLSVAPEVIAWGGNQFGQGNVPVDLVGTLAVAAGAYHSLALKKDGTVAVWGSYWENGSYQAATAPDGLTNITAVAGGSCFSMGLKTNGELVGWGNIEMSLDEYAIPGFPKDLSNIVAIAAHGQRGMALRKDGSVVAWNVMACDQDMAVTSVAHSVAIAAGGEHFLALNGSGTVTAWGNNTNGQCDVPAGLSNVIAIAAGARHSLALRVDGTVAAWGTNGNGSYSVPADLRNVTAIAAEGSNSLAVKADGTVVVWGSDGMRLEEVGWSNIVAIAGGDSHALALRGTGKPMFVGKLADRVASLGGTVFFHAAVAGQRPVFYQWQRNGVDLPGATNAVLWLTNIQAQMAGEYQLVVWNAYGTNVSENTSLSVVPLQVSQPVASRIPWAGSGVTLSVTVVGALPVTCQWRFNGAVLAGATNATLVIPQAQFDQAGAYSVTVSNAFEVLTSSPTQLPVSRVVPFGYDPYSQNNLPACNRAVAIACGAYNYVALQEDGNVIAWGDNLYQQGRVPARVSNAVAIASGGVHHVAILSDRSVAAWGGNFFGQCDVPAQLSNVVAIAAQLGGNLALKQDATVVGWGVVPDGNSYVPLTVPRDLSNIVAVALGGFHIMALNADGLVAVWNDYYRTNMIPKGLTDVVDIAAGYAHSLALKADGTVAAWGRNYSGQCDVPIGLSNVMAIAAGYDFSLALKNDGSVVAWGKHYDGIHFSPLIIPSELTNAVAIAANGDHGLALMGDGPPSLSMQLANRSADYGGKVFFRAAATGLPPLCYQWQCNGTNLLGATNAVLALTNVQFAQAGEYQVLVTNRLGSLTGQVATLAVNPGPVRMAVAPHVPGRHQFEFSLLSSPGRRMTVEVSTNLVEWSDLTLVTNETGNLTVGDSILESNRRFYRARPLP